MLRKLALVSAVLAGAALSTSALAAQSTATTTQQPAAAPSAKKTTTTMHAQSDSTRKTAAKSAAATTRHAAWTKEQIKEAQAGLSKAGLYKGKETGVMNADTKKAIRAYQKQNSMPVTGRLSDSLLVRLKSS